MIPRTLKRIVPPFLSIKIEINSKFPFSFVLLFEEGGGEVGEGFSSKRWSGTFLWGNIGLNNELKDLWEIWREQREDESEEDFIWKEER